MKNLQIFELNIFVLILVCPIPEAIGQMMSTTFVPEHKEAEDLQAFILNMDFKNTDLKDIIRLLAKQYGLNIFIADDVNKRLTLHLVNVSLAEALDFMLQETQLALQKTGSIYKIFNPTMSDTSVFSNPASKIDFQDGLLSVDFQDNDIREAFYQISKITNHTILLDANISGTITGLILGLPVDKALYFLAKNNGCYMIQEGPVFRIKKGRLDSSDRETKSANFVLIVHNNLIDMEVDKIELTNILEELFEQFGTSFFLIEEIKGTVTALAHDVTLTECLDILLGSNGYTYKKMEEHYLLGSKNNKLLLTSHLIPIKYLKVDNILEMLPEKIIENAEYKIIKEHNAVLIYGPHDQIIDIEQTIKDLDKPIPQILIEALVVDYYYQDIKEISLEGGLHGGNADTSKNPGDKWLPVLDVYLSGRNVNKYLNKLEGYFGFSNIGKLPEDFYLKVKALETIGKVNIRSKPQIATLNGYPADITIGQTQYYILTTQTPIRDPSQVYIQETQQFHTIEANITLKITPWVSASGEITVEIHPEFNNPVGQFSSEIPPTIQRRALNSTVRLQDGETIVLGGLIQTNESVNKFQLPILGSLPLIGNLFRSTNQQKVKSELIIYITPHLSYSENLIWGG